MKARHFGNSVGSVLGPLFGCCFAPESDLRVSLVFKFRIDYSFAENRDNPVLDIWLYGYGARK